MEKKPLNNLIYKINLKQIELLIKKLMKGKIKFNSDNSN